MNLTPLQHRPVAGEIQPERLAHNATLTEQQKIAEASRQFEAVLLRQILASSQKPVITSKLTDNSTAAGIYRDMITSQLADSISQSGSFGLAKTFEHQLNRPTAKSHQVGAGAGLGAKPTTRPDAPARRPYTHRSAAADSTVRFTKP